MMWTWWFSHEHLAGWCEAIACMEALIGLGLNTTAACLRRKSRSSVYIVSPCGVWAALRTVAAATVAGSLWTGEMDGGTQRIGDGRQQAATVA